MVIVLPDPFVQAHLTFGFSQQGRFAHEIQQEIVAAKLLLDRIGQSAVAPVFKAEHLAAMRSMMSEISA
jgi:hypothetical protein